MCSFSIKMVFFLAEKSSQGANALAQEFCGCFALCVSNYCRSQAWPAEEAQYLDPSCRGNRGAEVSIFRSPTFLCKKCAFRWGNPAVSAIIQTNSLLVIKFYNSPDSRYSILTSS